MKSRKQVRSSLSTRLAAYSATAGAAMLTAPAANAAVQNITSFPTTVFNFSGDSSSVNQAFSHGEFTGTNGTHKQMQYVPGFTTPGIPFRPPMPGHFTGTKNSHYIPGTPGSPGMPGMHFPGHSMTVATFHHGKALGINLAGAEGSVNRLSKGAAFSGLKFYNTHQVLASRPTGNAPIRGLFASNSGYIAFKDGSYYGWLKVRVGKNTGGAPDAISFLTNGNGDFGALDKTSNSGADGFTVGTVAPVPEPSAFTIAGLGLLALGAQGLRELRRRRQTAQK